MREHRVVVVLRGGGSWGEDVWGSAFSRDRKKLTFSFHVIFGCSGCNSQWWWHPLSSWVLHESSVWLGSRSGARTCQGVHSVKIETGEKNLLFHFRCSGCDSRWWWHPSSSRVLRGSSIWLGSVSVAVFFVSSRLGGRDLPGACLCTLGWFLSEKKPVSCRYKLVVKD
jgi:hypothetical protein